jgi:hypothetical protein
MLTDGTVQVMVEVVGLKERVSENRVPSAAY